MSSREDKIIILLKFSSIFVWKIKLNFIIYIIMANKRILDARACVKKYFNEASDDFKLLMSFIKGINANKLISKPIQAPSQELADTAINDPNIIIIKNKILEEFFIIKKKRIITFIIGVWTQ